MRTEGDIVAIYGDNGTRYYDPYSVRFINADGSVVDHRPWLNDLVLEMYGGEYD